MRAIEKVVQWARKRGISVSFDNRPAGDSEWAPISNKIVIGRGSRRTRLYMLLHECGHVLVNAKLPGYVARFVPLSDVDTVAEEIEAWRRGRRLAYRLGLRIDDITWCDMRRRYLTEYICWAADNRRLLARGV